MESDEEYRARLINAYGMWGAVCTEIIESSGVALDGIGEWMKVPRLAESGGDAAAAALDAKEE